MRQRAYALSLVALGLLVCAPGGLSQTSATLTTLAGRSEAKLPAFDVVSVKMDKSDTGNTSFNSDPTGINITGARLIDLIREAYGLYYAIGDQVLGLQGWATSERFNIEAKVGEADIPKINKLTREQSAEMLRSILADRFHLVAHKDAREMTVYALMIAKHGPKLTPANSDVPSPAGSKTSGCHAGCMSSDSRHLDAKGVGTDSLAGFLTGKTQRTVVDRTGLTGKYDFSLDYAPEEEHENGTAASSAAPELFTALQEQLGLKLEAAKGRVEIVVVDHVEQPSPN